MSAPADPIAAATHADPYPYYADLVARRPFAFDDRLGLWVAASAEAVTCVLGCSAALVRPPGQPVPPALAGSAAGDIFARFLRMRDGAGHAALRGPVVNTVERIRPDAVVAATGRQLDLLLARGHDLDGIIDRLPPLVAGCLTGVPDGDLPGIAGLAATFARGIAAGRPADQLAAAQVAAAELAERLARLQVRAFAGLESDLAIANLIGLMLQSYEATVGLIGLGLLAAARRPGPASENPDAFVLEVLRHDAAIQNTRRFMAADAVVAGRTVTAGQGVLVVLAAANRDPQVNPAPGDLRLDRPGRAVFTFGLGGHRCPARGMAVTIAATALGRLAGRVRADAPVRYRPSQNARMPVFG